MTCTGHTPEFVPVDSMREFARAMVMSAVKDIIYYPCTSTGTHFYSAVRFLLGNGNPYIYELCETFVAIPDLGELLHKRKQRAREKPKLTEQEADIVRILVRNNKDMPAEDLRKLATERLGKSVSLAQIGGFRSRKGQRKDL